MITATEALLRLKEGNERYISDSATSDVVLDHSRRTELVEGQHPFAIILGCSDSRAPAELIFEQGLGDLFVIRVAGNIAEPSQIGSVEFAATEFGTPLVVVMGHTHCGAVNATLQQIDRPIEQRSPNLEAIVSRIQPALLPLRDLNLSKEEMMQQAVRANVRTSMQNLKAGSSTIKSLILNNRLTIIGAIYDLQSGKVDFMEEM